MKNKVVILSLIGALASTALVGCGNRTSNNEQNFSTQSAQSSNNSENSQKSEDSSQGEKSPSEKIVGTFYCQADDNYYDFNEDGSASIYTKTNPNPNAGEIGIPARFIQENSKLIIYKGGNDENNKDTYSFIYDGKTLTLTDLKTNKVLVLTKVLAVS